MNLGWVIIAPLCVVGLSDRKSDDGTDDFDDAYVGFSPESSGSATTETTDGGFLSLFSNLPLTITVGSWKAYYAASSLQTNCFYTSNLFCRRHSSLGSFSGGWLRRCFLRTTPLIVWEPCEVLLMSSHLTISTNWDPSQIVIIRTKCNMYCRSIGTVSEKPTRLYLLLNSHQQLNFRRVTAMEITCLHICRLCINIVFQMPIIIHHIYLTVHSIGHKRCHPYLHLFHLRVRAVKHGIIKRFMATIVRPVRLNRRCAMHSQQE